MAPSSRSAVDAHPAFALRSRAGPTPPPPPDPGLATVIGRIVNVKGEFQPHVIVRLAEVVRGIEGRGGAFILDTAHSPSTFTDDVGYFIMSNIKGAEYVIVIGDIEITGIYEIIPQEDGTARVFNMPADQVTNVGDITITIQPPQLLPGLVPGTPSGAETTPGVYPPPISYPAPAVTTPYP
mgnify:CR=1 FL=1